MANYPVFHSKARFPGGELYGVKGPGKVLWEYTASPPPSTHTRTHTHKQTRGVTHTAPYILIPVRSGENDLQAELFHGGDVAKGQCTPCGVGGTTVERKAAGLFPIGMISGRSTSGHLPAAFLSTKGRNKSSAIPAVQTSACAMTNVHLMLLVILYLKFFIFAFGRTGL